MDPLEFMRSRIGDFPEYADEASRRLSDELVRAYLGEALTDMGERLSPLAELLEAQLGDLLLRVGFSNARAYQAYERFARTQTGPNGIVASDTLLIELADRARVLEAAILETFLLDVAAALDARDAAMLSA